MDHATTLTRLLTHKNALGHAEVNRRFNEAQLRFIRRVGQTERPWLQVQEHRGFEAGVQLVADLHAGRIAPLKGHVLVLS